MGLDTNEFWRFKARRVSDFNLNRRCFSAALFVFRNEISDVASEDWESVFEYPIEKVVAC